MLPPENKEPFTYIELEFKNNREFKETSPATNSFAFNDASANKLIVPVGPVDPVFAALPSGPVNPVGPVVPVVPVAPVLEAYPAGPVYPVIPV